MKPKYKGKSLITGKTVTGELFEHGAQRFIMADNGVTEVIPESVTRYCEYAGDDCHSPNISCGRCWEVDNS